MGKFLHPHSGIVDYAAILLDWQHIFHFDVRI